ncbi:UNVERIFIED_CONTAM: hypothetical protein Slati_0221000 [Sesamum latifolium]|uniref:Reverse transcriptase domain-containing protein n=1 Tax=Sesamum latifolium TaxID=2727402 RepID=A0AAW2YCE7_9LAMI
MIEDEVAIIYHITLREEDSVEEEDVEIFPPELEGVKITVDELKEINLGNVENPRPIYISALLTDNEEEAYVDLLHEFKDVFAWSYKEMPGLDPKDLNSACPKDDFSLPIAELMIDATTGHEALSFMDGSSRYNQIRMAPKDKELMAFCTPKEIYCYKVMSFGLKNAGVTYQRTMQKIFDDMLHKNIECYVDDLVVKSKMRQDHLQDLMKIFERLKRYQLKMNSLKCAFGVTPEKFLGFIVFHRGIEIEYAKIDAILKMPEPRNIHEFKSLQGKLAYL